MTAPVRVLALRCAGPGCGRRFTAPADEASDLCPACQAKAPGPAPRVSSSHRLVGRSDRAGGGVRHDVVRVEREAGYWGACPKCGGRRGSMNAADPGPHAPHYVPGRSGLFDCVGDDVTDWYARANASGVR